MFNKMFTVALIAVFATACAPKNDDNGPTQQPPVAADASIIGKFVNVNASSVLPAVDFSSASLGQESIGDSVVDCDGSLGNNNMVEDLGVTEGNLFINGSEQEGEIQFGHLEYVGATNFAQCRAMSKEKYTYSITGDTLTLCSVKWNVCETFNKQ